MAIKELFNDARPQVLFDPRASQRIDPRFKFTRNGSATYVDRLGILRTAGANEPRLEYDGATGEQRGLLLETTGTNKQENSESPLRCEYYTVYTSASNITTGPITITSNAGTRTAYVTEVLPDGANCRVYIGSIDGNVSNPATFTQGGSSYSGNGNRVLAGYDVYNTSGTNADFPTLSSVLAPNGADFAYIKNGGIVRPYSFVDWNSTIPSFLSVYVKAGTATQINIANSYNSVLFSTFSFVSESFTFLHPQNKAHYVEKLANGWYRIGIESIGVRRFYSRIEATGSYYFWGFQYEWTTADDRRDRPSSYIKTPAESFVTRAADLISIESPLPETGSIYIDARSLTSDVDNTLLSAAPASPSTDKLALAIREPADLYNSKALVYEVDGAFKPTLPFPVPTNARERNLITYGANNYHYRSDSARYTPSSSTSVPANMTRLGIGHDVTDPTKAFNGYINAVYLWPGEITPTVAEALVRGDVDPKDADAGVFTPAAGSLAFVFNTQGTSTDGNTVVQLPLRGSTNNVLVDWGDNTSSSLIGAAASVTVDHTYTAAGIYPVQITADDDGTNSGLENLQFYNNSPADLVRVLQWGGTTTFQPTTMYRIFRDCTQMDFENDARTNLPDTSGCSDWREAFYNCSSLSGQYPNFDHSGATQLSGAWYGCSSITSFSSSLDDLNSAGNFVTNYSNTWDGCSSITSFPTITIPNDQGDVNLTSAWNGCSNLNSFPVGIDTSAVTNFQYAWQSCTSLESFPLINTSSGTNFIAAWSGCSSLDNIANAGESTSFPLINTSAGTDFRSTWRNCSSLTSFPLIDVSSGTTFYYAWQNCSSLTDFPANFFDSWSPASIANQCFYLTWDGCTSLTPASVVNILNSIAASGQSAPTGTGTYDKAITIDWDGTGNPATDAAAAITTLKSRNWQIYLNNVLQ